MPGGDTVGLPELTFGADRKTENETEHTAASEVTGGAEIVVDMSPFSAEGLYRDTALPFSGDSPGGMPRQLIPERLRKMRRLFDYSSQSRTEKAGSFVKQARFMEDYEDDAPWSGDFLCYFPCYQDMTTRQLRGYFSWRTRIRKGEYIPISTSAAYVYVYELMNGVGASSPEDSLQKLMAFDEGYLQRGMGDPKMRLNLWNWMFELAVVNSLPLETVKQFMSPKLLEEDAALAVLRNPEEASDDVLFGAMSEIYGNRILKSKVLSADHERGKYLFAACWRRGIALSRGQEKDLFALCFGKKVFRDWFPFRNALYCPGEPWADRDYILSECRSYHCRNGRWREAVIDRKGTDAGKLRGFLREAERKLRQYLKTGGSLKASPEDAWADPYIDAAIEADRKAVLEASRPKITIDLSGLEQIRRDAAITRNSLLSEEERALMEGEEVPENISAVNNHAGKLPEDSTLTDTPVGISLKDSILTDTPVGISLKDSPHADTAAGKPFQDSIHADTAEGTLHMDCIHLRILKTLLAGGSVKELIRTNHLMPSMVADAVNEALYDEIGDTVLLCEEDELSIVEDYLEDLQQLPGLREL